MDYQFGLIYDCITTDSNVLHQFKSYLQSLSCINILCSVHKRGGLKKDFEIRISIHVFNDVSNKLVFAHCTVTFNVLTVADGNLKRCIFPIFPVNVQQSYGYR